MEYRDCPHQRAWILVDDNFTKQKGISDGEIESYGKIKKSKSP
jgi:hypothetical protein